MARSLDSEQTTEKEKGFTVNSQDVELATRMGVKLLNEANGIAVIRQALDQSKDPAQVIGQFLAQMMGTMAEQLAQQLGVDPRVFLAKRGFLDNILNYIERKLGMPEEFSDQIYAQVLETIKAAAFGGQAQDQQTQQPPAPQEQAAPVPAGPGPQQQGVM